MVLSLKDWHKFLNIKHFNLSKIGNGKGYIITTGGIERIKTHYKFNIKKYKIKNLKRYKFDKKLNMWKWVKGSNARSKRFQNYLKCYLQSKNKLIYFFEIFSHS